MRGLSVALFVAALTVARVGAGHDSTSPLPLGDAKVSTEPRRGYVFACNNRFPGGGGAHRIGEWIRNGFWYPAEKPVVEGEVEWPAARISTDIEGTERVIRTNALPRHNTGRYPIRIGSRAYEYDRNPNPIREQDVIARLPATPALASTPGCVPMGAIGISVTGAAIFNAFDLMGRDAPAYEIQDRCAGHPERGGRYHYHDWSPCIPDEGGKAGRHSELAGFMMDGIPIYGPRGEGGVALRNEDLDECHGHVHEVLLDGRAQRVYHYHFTAEYPYTIGCFRGATVLRTPGKPPPPIGK